MGKKLIIPNADFSQNAIVIPLSVTLGAGKSYTLGGQIVTNNTDADKTYEFSSVYALARRSSFSETNDAIRAIDYGSQVDLAGSSFFKNYIGLKQVYFKDKIVTSSYANTFENCSSLEKVLFGSSDNYNVAGNMTSVFDGCSSLKEIDLSKFNTVNCTDFSNIFKNCTSLIKITLGLGFVISSNAGTAAFFNNCGALSTIDCTVIDSTSEAGAALKNKIESLITATGGGMSSNINVLWANNVTRHWNGSTWIDVE